MPSTTIHLPDDIHHDVQLHATENEKSFSAACRILIETALKVEKMKKDPNTDAQHLKSVLEEKQIQYLLQNLNITKEILRCVFRSDAVGTGGMTAEENLNIIKEGTQQYIDGLLGKDV